MPDFHPDLKVARFLPNFSFGARTASMARRLAKYAKPPKLPPGVTVEERIIPGGPEVRVRLYRPATRPRGAMLWIHGGGFIIGDPMQDELSSAGFASELGLVVVAVSYRLAPQHPFPAPVDDCYAALKWLHAEATRLEFDPARIIIGGASAGAGLAAGLSLLAHDRAEVKPMFQLLIYPMLDDRTVTRSDLRPGDLRVWSVGSNEYGWRSYLNAAPGGANVSPYAAPARREVLSGLPPAWIGVGTLDLFHDEDLAYARRLKEAGVACELTIVPGAFHGFDAIFPKAAVTRDFRDSQLSALRRAL